MAGGLPCWIFPGISFAICASRFSGFASIRSPECCPRNDDEGCWVGGAYAELEVVRMQEKPMCTWVVHVWMTERKIFYCIIMLKRGSNKGVGRSNKRDNGREKLLRDERIQ